MTTTINGERSIIHTGLKIEPQYWIKTRRNEIGERALETNELGRVQLEYNKNINKQLEKIRGYCREYAVLVNSPTLMTNKPMIHNKANFETFIKNKLDNKTESTQSFIEDYIERKKSTVNKNMRILSKGTIYNHKNTLNRLLSFCEAHHVRLTWDLFNEHFEERFTAWMNTEKYAANTIVSSLSIIKAWLRKAEKKGFIIDQSYREYKTQSLPTENIYLTEEEINRLYSIDFQSDDIRAKINPQMKNIEATRDLFIVACWTGLRYGDIKDLTNSAIDTEGNTMTIHTHKTGVTVKLPLHDMVREIINKYEGQLPAAPDKTRSLEHLKICGALAGINTQTTINVTKGGERLIKSGPKYQFIKNHTARRSFATNMFLKGAQTASIMAMTGHTTEANFRQYIKADRIEHIKNIARAFRQDSPIKPVALQH